MAEPTRPPRGLLSDFRAFLASHRLLWLGPVALGLAWLVVLHLVTAGGSSAETGYVLS
ncbi:MAG: hypothetical protein AAF726_14865 [Planctomycetota bacterium]